MIPPDAATEPTCETELVQAHTVKSFHAHPDREIAARLDDATKAILDARNPGGKSDRA